MKPHGKRPPRRAAAGPNQAGKSSRPPKQPPRRDAALPTLRVVHEDAHILVVSKPPGVLTSSPVPAAEMTLLDLALRHRRGHASRRAKLWTLHRVDREASGLVVFAASPSANEHVRNQFRAGKVSCIFEAVVQGRLRDDAEESGTIRSLLQEDRDGFVEAVSESAFGVREARPVTTHYRVLARSSSRSLLRLRLSRNHKHQARAHAKHIGHTIVGDTQYGATDDALGRLALHACEIMLIHPGTGESVRYKDPTPDSFQSLTDDAQAPDTSWDHVAEWYAGYQASHESDHFQDVILPGTLRLLGDLRGTSLLDLACGEGTLVERCAAEGAVCVGIDASPELIERARSKQIPSTSFANGDATRLSDISISEGPSHFDAASCVMALMNMDPLEAVFQGIADRLRTGGRFVAVMLHPAFRAPRRTSWGWHKSEQGKPVQHRRVDAYLSTADEAIVMNPGRVASGDRPIETTTFNRPLQDIINSMSDAGLLVDRLEEWPSARVSEPGPRASAENFARREIPLFLGIRGIRVDRIPPA
ncbi:MAG: pseudouridine synthase [Planctomycetota bacterium]